MEKVLLGALPQNRRPIVRHSNGTVLGGKPKKEREKLVRTGMHFVG